MVDSGGNGPPSSRFHFGLVRNSWFEIYDYGVGDEVVWPYSVSVTLDQAGQYRVVSPVPVKAELPKGGKVTLAVPGKAR